MPFRLFKGLLPWRRAAAVRDAAAGVVLASMDIPQLLGYARIAGMPARSQAWICAQTATQRLAPLTQPSTARSTTP